MRNHSTHPQRAFLLLAILLLSGCTSLERSGGSTDPDRTEEHSDDANTITAEEAHGNSARNVADLLEGRVAGVHVRETPGGGVSILVRGVRTIQGDNTPLYVIDGVPVNPGPDGEVPGISIYEIESIEVLKDMAAASRYGMRGTHGVVLIKTKRPPDPN